MQATKATVKTAPSMIARPLTFKQSTISVMPSNQIRRTGANSTVMRGFATKSSSTYNSKTSPSIDTASVSAAFDQAKISSNILNNPIAPKMPLKIENSSLAQSMWCRENSEGAIQCDLEDDFGKPTFEFDIEDILERDQYKNLDPNYWNSQWDEQLIY